MTELAALEPSVSAERQRKDFAFRRGEDVTIRFTAFQAGGDIEDLSQRFDLTGATIEFKQKLNAVDTAAEITKTVGSGITILTQTVGAATRGQFDLLLDKADTASLPVGRHVYDVRFNIAGTGNETISFGVMSLLKEISAL